MPPRRWTTDELDTANKMLSEGASFVEIGESIDRTATAVEAKLKGKSTPKTISAKESPETKQQTDGKAESTESTGSVVEVESVTTEPQHIEPTPSPASNDEMPESSTSKYIIGAVIAAVVIWLVLG